MSSPARIASTSEHASLSQGSVIARCYRGLGLEFYSDGIPGRSAEATAWFAISTTVLCRARSWIGSWPTRCTRRRPDSPRAGHFWCSTAPKKLSRFWDATFDADRRAGFRWPGLFKAPVIVVPLSSEDAYLDRYAEPDKGWTDRDPERWPVPYWHIDTGFASLLMLLTCRRCRAGRSVLRHLPSEGIQGGLRHPGRVHADRGDSDRISGPRRAVAVSDAAGGAR